MTKDLTQLRALCDAATPGPWKHGKWQYESDGGLQWTHIAPEDKSDMSITVDGEPGRGVSEPTSAVIGGCGCCGSPFGDNAAADGALIAAARTDLPELIDEVAKLRAALAEALGGWVEQHDRVCNLIGLSRESQASAEKTLRIVELRKLVTP